MLNCSFTRDASTFIETRSPIFFLSVIYSAFSLLVIINPSIECSLSFDESSYGLSLVMIMELNESCPGNLERKFSLLIYTYNACDTKN